MNKKFLTQEVNFALSVTLIGSAALLGMVLMLKAAEIENPLIDRAVVFAAEME